MSTNRNQPPNRPLEDCTREHCILLIDDNEMDFLLTQEMFNLVKHGDCRYQLYWEPDGERALQSLINNEYDLYLLDYNIGQWNGIELLERAKKRCENPIIMLTDHDQYDVDQQAMNLGAWDFILKRDLSPKRIERALRYATNRKNIMDDLKQQACIDELTGLSNRRHFNRHLDEFIALSARHKHELCLCLCDIDHFKSINDQYGHAAGDAALIHFSKIIQKNLRNEDRLSRLGGDEFAILFPHIDDKGVYISIQRILQSLLDQPVEHDGKSFELECSFGIATYQPSMSRMDLLNQADQALYAAKQQGRKRACVYSQRPAFRRNA